MTNKTKLEEAKERLKKQLDAGEITEEQYQMKLKAIEEALEQRQKELENKMP